MKIKIGDIVCLRPLSNKMKTRIQVHGEQMEVVALEKIVCGKRRDLLVRSLKPTFQNTPWMGWIVLGEDCNIG